jgi:hypothetical protein
MAINILEKMQQTWGCLPLQKIDPNTQQPIDNADAATHAQPLEQAAIVVVLAGLYKTLKENPTLNWGNDSTNFTTYIFGNDTSLIIDEVAKYATVGTEKAKTYIEKAATIAHDIIDAEIKDPTYEHLHDFILSQRNNILPYLPPTLQSGALLNDNTLDDNTNKMQGPISGLMHFFEKVFSDNK